MKSDRNVLFEVRQLVHYFNSGSSSEEAFDTEAEIEIIQYDTNIKFRYSLMVRDQPEFLSVPELNHPNHGVIPPKSINTNLNRIVRRSYHLSQSHLECCHVGVREIIEKDIKYWVERNDFKVVPYDPDKRWVINNLIQWWKCQVDREIKIEYKNYRGETRYRRILPRRIEELDTAWHNRAWVVTALDLDKGEERHFAMTNFNLRNIK